MAPKEQAIVAIGTCGYQWDDAGDSRPAEAVTFADVMRSAREHHGSVTFVSPSPNPVAM